ncbi:MAG: protein-disulfide isomerase [Rickettsiales bacterium]|jgi:protein-disulfide isomerase
MTNKSTSQNFFTTKTTIIILLIALVSVGAYALIDKKESKTESNSEEKVELKSSGLDLEKEVKNIGDVEDVIAKWVETNPEAIIKSVVKMQQEAAQQQQQGAQENISSRKNDILKDKTDPVYAPKGYDVSIVEFFDYNCGYCKRAQETVEKLIKEDKKVRVIFKELPILGQSSVELSKVALAVNILDSSKYVEFHDALMKGSAKTKDGAIKIAKELGINVEKLNKVLDNKESEISAKIAANQELASSIGINGTPAFIIGETLVPGALDIDSLKEKISAERKK